MLTILQVLEVRKLGPQTQNTGLYVYLLWPAGRRVFE